MLGAKPLDQRALAGTLQGPTAAMVAMVTTPADDVGYSSSYYAPYRGYRWWSRSLSPEVFEPSRWQLGVAHRSSAAQRGPPVRFTGWPH